MSPSATIGITNTAPGLVRVALRGFVGPLVVDQLRVQLDELVRNGVGMVTGIVVNLSAVSACDCRLLPVLHAAQRQMFEAHGWLVARGVDPQLLSGFAAVGLSDALAVYRASLALAEPAWPKEPGWTGDRSRSPHRRRGPVLRARRRRSSHGDRARGGGVGRNGAALAPRGARPVGRPHPMTSTNNSPAASTELTATGHPTMRR
jgi:anti-anti-sigma regulatory factor